MFTRTHIIMFRVQGRSYGPRPGGVQGEGPAGFQRDWTESFLN